MEEGLYESHEDPHFLDRIAEERAHWHMDIESFARLRATGERYEHYSEDPYSESNTRCRGSLIRRDKWGVWDDDDWAEEEIFDFAAAMFYRIRGQPGEKLKGKWLQGNKGSGAWGRELESGNFLIIHDVKVHRLLQRQGVGTGLVEAMVARARKELGDQFFVIGWPAALPKDIAREADLQERQESEVAQEMNQAAIAFWRAIGFRRIGDSGFFGFSDLPDHPSKQIPADADYDPPPSTRPRSPGGPVFVFFKQVPQISVVDDPDDDSEAGLEDGSEDDPEDDSENDFEGDPEDDSKNDSE